MSARESWLGDRSTELRAALLDLGLTMTDADARSALSEKIDENAARMGLSHESAQQDFTDADLVGFAHSLALSISDEAPGADLVEFERTISMPVTAVGLTTAAMAEALKVSHANLDDKAQVAGLSLLSTLGMITAEASTFLVPVPRPLLLRIARFLDTVAGSISDGANLPDGLEQLSRSDFADILRQDADGIRTIANTDNTDDPTLWRTPTTR
jgi:hypothetical protein